MEAFRKKALRCCCLVLNNRGKATFCLHAYLSVCPSVSLSACLPVCLPSCLSAGGGLCESAVEAAVRGTTEDQEAQEVTEEGGTQPRSSNQVQEVTRGHAGL